MSCQDKGKVLCQLGSITWQLSTLRFGQIGSLVEHDGDLQLKTCLCRGLVTYDRHELEDIDRGPYLTPSAYFNALVSAFSGHARFLYTAPHCLFAPVPLLTEFSKFAQYRAACDRWNDFVILGDKVDSSQNRLDYVIPALGGTRRMAKKHTGLAVWAIPPPSSGSQREQHLHRRPVLCHLSY